MFENDYPQIPEDKNPTENISRRKFLTGIFTVSAGTALIGVPVFSQKAEKVIEVKPKKISPELLKNNNLLSELSEKYEIEFQKKIVPMMNEINQTLRFLFEQLGDKNLEIIESNKIDLPNFLVKNELEQEISRLRQLDDYFVNNYLWDFKDKKFSEVFFEFLKKRSENLIKLLRNRGNINKEVLDFADLENHVSNFLNNEGVTNLAQEIDHSEMYKTLQKSYYPKIKALAEEKNISLMDAEQIFQLTSGFWNFEKLTEETYKVSKNNPLKKLFGNDIGDSFEYYSKPKFDDLILSNNLGGANLHGFAIINEENIRLAGENRDGVIINEISHKVFRNLFSDISKNGFDNHFSKFKSSKFKNLEIKNNAQVDEFLSDVCSVNLNPDDFGKLLKDLFISQKDPNRDVQYNFTKSFVDTFLSQSKSYKTQTKKIESEINNFTLHDLANFWQKEKNINDLFENHILTNDELDQFEDIFQDQKNSWQDNPDFIKILKLNMIALRNVKEIIPVIMSHEKFKEKFQKEMMQFGKELVFFLKNR